MIERDLSKRLTIPDAKTHPFFEQVKWDEVGHKLPDEMGTLFPTDYNDYIDKVSFGNFQDFDEMDLEDALELLNISSDEEVEIL